MALPSPPPASSFFPREDHAMRFPRPRSVVVVTPPVVEPVPLDLAKSQCGLVPEQQDDDEILLTLIATARRLCERRLGVALVATQYRAKWGFNANAMGAFADESTAWPNGVELPNPPLLISGSYPISLTVDGTAMDAGSFAIDADCRPALIRFNLQPGLGWAGGELTATYWAGVAPGQQIAPQIRSAMLLIIRHLYDNRSAVPTDVSAIVLPMAVETLLASESIDGRF